MSDRSTMQAAAIRELCKSLHLPTVAGQAIRVAEQAAKEQQSHLCYLEALLSAEVEEREQNSAARRIKEAHFPKVKTLEEFNFRSHRTCRPPCFVSCRKAGTSAERSRSFCWETRGLARPTWQSDWE